MQTMGRSRKSSCEISRAVDPQLVLLVFLNREAGPCVTETCVAVDGRGAMVNQFICIETLGICRRRKKPPNAYKDESRAPASRCLVD
jgi:hypothetical protein